MEKFSVQTDISVLEVWTRTGFEIVRALINPGPATNTADRRIPTAIHLPLYRNFSSKSTQDFLLTSDSNTHRLKVHTLSHFVLNSIFTYH